jgi:hypothetical protein
MADPARVVGNLVDIYDQRSRFVVSRFTANTDLIVGAFAAPIATAASHPLYGYTRIEIPTATGAKIMGAVVINPTKGFDHYVWDETLGIWKYKAGKIVSLVTDVDLYMYSEVTVNVGDDVYFRHTANAGLTRIGALANAAGTGLDKHPTAKFIEKISAPGPVAVRLI